MSWKELMSFALEANIQLTLLELRRYNL